MANQPPTRPWFRVPSVARPKPAPAPTPAPAIKTPQPKPHPPPITQTQSTQPQHPTTTILPPVNALAPVPAPSTNGVASLPTSPLAPRAYAPSSLPTSLIKTTTGLVPSPPKLGDTITATTTSSVPSFPALRPVATTSSVPTSPAKPLPTTSSVSTSPESKPVTTTSSAAITREPTPPSSPSLRTIRPAARAILPESPKLKSSAPLPSPLILQPPTQKKSDEPPRITLEAEQKIVLVQQTIDKPKVAGLYGSETQRAFADPLDPSIDRLEKLAMSKDMEPKGKIHGKKISSDSEETGMRVITIAGENEGAFMEVFHSPKKHAFENNNPHHLHMKGNPKNDEHKWGNSSSEEGKAHKIKSHKGKGMTTSLQPMSAFMNSNVQGVNNSIVNNSSCTCNDPGVHVAVSRKPEGGGYT